MNLLFEDGGQLKAGTLLADNDASLQVEAVSGKRQKVKAGHVLLRFVAPSPAEMLARAHELARGIDPDFLWEVSGEAEFGFDELANEYFGGTPAPPESAAVALALSAAPMYFYRKGRGRYRRAPPEALEAALASIARKEREARDIAAWAAELGQRRLPAALASRLDMLLYRPDKHAPEWKALGVACETAKSSPLQLIAACGAIPSTHDYHFRRFLVESYPAGTEFPAWGEMPALPELPIAQVEAFSIDDATTTEIDDAFSVRYLVDGNVRIGIHIACPALAIGRGSALDAIARARLSTVYMPGRKLTMLPERVVGAFTLAQGTSAPVVSLYVEMAPDGTAMAQHTALERVPVVENLRLDALTDAFATAVPAPGELARFRDLRALLRFATRLFDARGKADPARVDYSFDVDWDVEAAGERGRVSIVAARARQCARPAGLRADDPRQPRVGEGAGRRAGAGHVSRAVRRQGQDEHASG